MVETVITGMACDHLEVFHVMQINGFIHTDDKLALREIWRPFRREVDVEDDNMGTSGKRRPVDLVARAALPSCARVGSCAANSVIFILDEFNLFASQLQQALLYNLFDVSQSRSAPILVVGVPAKVEVAKSPEKRVKSRFGQHYVHASLHATNPSLPHFHLSTDLHPSISSFHPHHCCRPRFPGITHSMDKIH